MNVLDKGGAATVFFTDGGLWEAKQREDKSCDGNHKNRSDS